MTESATSPTNATRVVVVGQGYVGLPLAMRSNDAGYDVVGFDVDDARIGLLASGRSLTEDVTDEAVAAALATGRYHPTTEARDCAGFDVAVITVPTPLREGAPDLSYVTVAAQVLARFLRPGSLVVLESTTYPGTTEELVAPILEEGSGLIAGGDFHLGYSPERIDPGNETWTIGNTPKVVSGVDEDSLHRVRDFYESIVECTVAVRGTREAELTKLIENTFRHVNIALTNEIAIFAADMGIDVWASLDAASTKPYGFMRFSPGPGVGGHCLPIDPSYLSWRVRRSLGRAFRFVELANDINDHMPDYVVDRIIRLLNTTGAAVNGSRVLLLGLAYKRNSSDPRESPAAAIVRQLVDLGAVVRVADPHVVEGRFIPSGAQRVDVTDAEIRDADIVVLVTDHDAFPYDAIAENARLVFDTRNRLSGANVHRI